MSIHWQAMEHLRKAKSLLASAGDDELRYAALEMRYCIEHLFYRLIPVYERDLPDNVLSGGVWKPAEIIDMLVAIDPGVEHAQTISYGSESVPGVASDRMYVLGRQTGFRRDLARRIYQALGSYLHARVDQKPHDSVKLRAKLLKVLPRLEAYENDTVVAGGFAARSSFNCKLCQRVIAKRPGTIAENPYVVCPNTKCGAIYHCVQIGPEMVEHTMLQEKVVCKKCGTPNWIGVHLLKRGAQTNGVLTCAGCEARYQMFEYVMLKDVEAAQPA